MHADEAGAGWTPGHVPKRTVGVERVDGCAEGGGFEGERVRRS